MFAYVGCWTTPERNGHGEGINVYRIDADTGRWTHVQLVSGLVNPSFLAFDRTGRFLYTVHADGSELSAFAVDPSSGRLRFLNRESTGGKNPVHLAIDPGNRFFVVSNYASGTLAVLPIDEDGRLAPLTDLTELHGKTGPHKVQQRVSHPHHNPFDREGRFVLVPDKGLDEIFVFRLDADAGKLIANDPPSVKTRAGAAPRHIDCHPDQSHCYVLNELDSTITTYQYDAVSGHLIPVQIVSSLPDTFVGNNTGAEIFIAPSGRFLYASNRGHGSIGVFAVDPDNGHLSPVSWQSTQGMLPRFFAFDPSATFLYAANEDSDVIVQFQIDAATGQLNPSGEVIHTASPVCIVFSDSRRQ